MELGSSREERFISKLIKDTKKGDITWEDLPNRVLNLPSNERAIGKVYKTSINDQNLRIYEYQIKHYQDEYSWDWVERLRLELIDNDDDTLFEFSEDYSLFKLYNAVRKANSNVDEIMKDFLKEN